MLSNRQPIVATYIPWTIFIELAILIVVAVALLIALVVTIRKLGNEKKHLCLVNRDAFYLNKNQ